MTWAQASDAAAIHNALAPSPQRVTRLAGVVPVPIDITPALLHRATLAPAGLAFPLSLSRWLSVHIHGAHCGSDLATQQRYELSIDPLAATPITIRAAAPAAARLALMTLAQLVRLCPRELPALRIDDWPAIPRRGVMLDVSRTRVPTMQHLLATIDTLAELKINHVQLYIEHTFAYAKHVPAWQGLSPITPSELRRLDAYCAERGLDLAANQNCFGHLSHWLRHPHYAHLAETHGDWMFDIWPRSGPFSLCPTDPRSLELVREWITEQAACIRGDWFNINCDETYDIAFGRSASEVAARGRTNVYTDFVCNVAAIVREQRKRPMFWGDVVLPAERSAQDRACLERLRDAGLTALVWGYEPDAPFADNIHRVHDAGMPAWACPGTSCWRSITGRTTQRVANVAAACRAAVDAHADGVLLCAWGDLGHWQQWPITLHAIAQSATALWRGEHAHSPSDRASHGVHVFGAQAGHATATWLDALGDADLELRAVSGPYSKPGLVTLRNATPLFASLHQPIDVVRSIAHAELWTHTADRLMTLGHALPAASPLLRDELRWTWECAAFAAARACLALNLHDHARTLQAAATTTYNLTTWYDAIARDRRRLWMIRSRAGGIEDSCRFDATVRGFLGALHSA